MSRTRVAICTPALGGMVHITHAHSVAAAVLYLEAGGQYEIGWLNYGNVASVTKARNAMVAQALAQGYDEIVMIDADISFHPTQLERLLSHELNIVGGLQRNTYEGSAQWPMKTIDPDAVTVNENVAEVAAIPTCFMRIRAPALLHMMATRGLLQYEDPRVIGSKRYLYALFDYRIHQRRYEGEDYSFCRLAREVGLKVHADLEINLTHHRSVPLTGRLIDELTREGTA